MNKAIIVAGVAGAAVIGLMVANASASSAKPLSGKEREAIIRSSGNFSVIPLAGNIQGRALVGEDDVAVIPRAGGKESLKRWLIRHNLSFSTPPNGMLPGTSHNAEFIFANKFSKDELDFFAVRQINDGIADPAQLKLLPKGSFLIANPNDVDEVLDSSDPEVQEILASLGIKKDDNAQLS